MIRNSSTLLPSRTPTSTSNARRVIEQGGVNIGPDRTAITNPKEVIALTNGLIVRVGKRKIAQVRLDG